MKLLKNISLAIASVAMVTAVAQAQGTIDVNLYDAGAAVYLNNLSTAAPVGTTYFELLGGASAGSLSPVVNINNHVAIVTLTDSNPNGQNSPGGGGTGLDTGYGPTLGVASMGTGFYQVLIWTGSPVFASATSYFESAIWSEQAGNDPTVGSPPPAPAPANLNVSFATPVWGSCVVQSAQEALIMAPVPEPATMALLGLGSLSLLLFRRRQ